MEIWVILSSATHATERNASITSAELKECWPRSGLDIYFGVCITSIAQPGTSVKKRGRSRVEAQLTPASPDLDQSSNLAHKSLNISDAGTDSRVLFRIARTQQISCRFISFSALILSVTEPIPFKAQTMWFYCWDAPRFRRSIAKLWELRVTVVRVAAALAILKMDDMPDPCKSSSLSEPRLDVASADRQKQRIQTTFCIRFPPPPQPYLQCVIFTKDFSPLNGCDSVCAIEGSMICCV
jgi:hypothetical protein